MSPRNWEVHLVRRVEHYSPFKLMTIPGQNFGESLVRDAEELRYVPRGT